MNDNNVYQDKNPEKNSIYARVFTKALHEINYVAELTINNKTIYPATLSDRVYWLTNCMVTAFNMSWSNTGLTMKEGLKQLPAAPIGDDGLFN